jgi:hypothetical protein
VIQSARLYSKHKRVWILNMIKFYFWCVKL